MWLKPHSPEFRFHDMNDPGTMNGSGFVMLYVQSRGGQPARVIIHKNSVRWAMIDNSDGRFAPDGRAALLLLYGLLEGGEFVDVPFLSLPDAKA